MLTEISAGEEDSELSELGRKRHVEHAWQNRALLMSGCCSILPLDFTPRPGAEGPQQEEAGGKLIELFMEEATPGRDSHSSLLVRSWFVPLN